ncbi:MAG: hypothetical protein JF609_06110 [Verrucomicrobia bacterium]|nr:hypothetical protein [Verrucomicrobiota bacterium]
MRLTLYERVERAAVWAGSNGHVRAALLRVADSRSGGGVTRRQEGADLRSDWGFRGGFPLVGANGIVLAGEAAALTAFSTLPTLAFSLLP